MTKTPFGASWSRACASDSSVNRNDSSLTPGVELTRVSESVRA